MKNFLLIPSSVVIIVSSLLIFFLLSGSFHPETSNGPSDQDNPRKVDSGDRGCRIGGCSGQLCVDSELGDVISTCEYRADYACYKSATCERQLDGRCGWTKTPQLTACLNHPPPLSPPSSL